MAMNKKVVLGVLIGGFALALLLLLQITQEKGMDLLLINPEVEMHHSDKHNFFPFIENFDSDTKLKHLREASTMATQLQQSLVSKYGTDNAGIFTVFDIPEQTRLFLMSRMMYKVAKSQKLVFGFTGTSVTAGHDVYYNESYPLVVGQTLSPIFKTLGIKFESRNLALGNNPVVPYNLCLKTIVGPDVDLISWEQAMMCPGSEAKLIEVFLRNSMAIESHPALLVLDAVPDEQGLTGLRETKKRFFMQDSIDIRKVYSKFPVHSLISVESITQVKSNRDAFNKTRMMYEGKPFPKSGAWHPGKYGHQYVADLLSYSYAGIIAEMADMFSLMIQQAESEDQLIEKVKLQATFGQYKLEDLPAPVWTPEESEYYFLDSPGQSCATFFEPRTLAADFDLKNFIVSGDFVDLRNHVEQYTNQSWGITIFKTDVNGVKEMLKWEKGYKDLKWVLAGNKASGDLEFQFNVESNASPLMLCDAPGPWGKYPEGYAMLNQDGAALVYVDGEQVVLTKNNWGSCYQLGVRLSPGVHRLKISPQSENRLAISHLIWK